MPGEGSFGEHFDELKPGCANSNSAHADRAAAREQQVQPLKERVQRRTPEQIVDVPVVTQTGPHDPDTENS